MSAGDDDNQLKPIGNVSSDDNQKLARELGRTLDEAERQIAEVVHQEPSEIRTWRKARELVERLRPVPWFIWRIPNFVFGKDGKINQLPEGMLIGLKRVVCRAASDPYMGVGREISTVRDALKVITADVIAAVSVIHSIGRRMESFPHSRIWGPILDDALLRAQIGHDLGRRRAQFGGGRGMLAGFASRIGMAVLIALADQAQATKALERLAGGAALADVGIEIFGCAPLQVSAMLLTAAGCGKDAAFGILQFGAGSAMTGPLDTVELQWASAITLCEHVRLGQADQLQDSLWDAFAVLNDEERRAILDDAKISARRGTSWGWLIQGTVKESEQPER